MSLQSKLESGKFAISCEFGPLKGTETSEIKENIEVLKGKVVEPIQYVDIQPGSVSLLIEATPLSYEFICISSTGEKQSLGTALTKDVSSEEIVVDDPFTVVFFGMYATGNGKPCTIPADFAWFEYNGKDRR